jgi:hypothetical protein
MEHESASLPRRYRGIPRRMPEPRENPNRELLLTGWAFRRQGFPEAGIELALESSDEPLALLEESSQPRMIRLVEEARHHRAPDEPIAERTVGRQALGASARPG